MMALLSTPDMIVEEEDLWETWKDYGEKTRLEARQFALELVRGVEEKKDELDRLIQEKMEHWKLERIGRVERNILRVALFEITGGQGVPVSVAINEAVDLAKRYGDKDAGKFINGVLGTWAPPQE
jgi:N utilization substance protein B